MQTSAPVDEVQNTCLHEGEKDEPRRKCPAPNQAYRRKADFVLRQSRTPALPEVVVGCQIRVAFSGRFPGGNVDKNLKRAPTALGQRMVVPPTGS